MALKVQIELLADDHYHAGTRYVKGDVFAVAASRAPRLIDSGIGQKVGVVDEDAYLEVPVEADETEIEESPSEEDLED